MNLALQKTVAESAFLDAASHVQSDPVRRRAFEDFVASGLPHRRMEDWRWTDLRQLVDGAYPPARAKHAAKTEVKPSPFTHVVRGRIVLVDGVFAPELSQLPASSTAEVTPVVGHALLDPAMGEALSPSATLDPILAMNTAFLAGGVSIHVPAGTTIDTPIEIVVQTTKAEPRTVATRIHLSVGEGASASVVETYLDDGGRHLTNAVTRCRLADGARLDRVKFQAEGRDAIHLSNFDVVLGRGSVLRDCTVTSGAALTRQQGFVTFLGTGGDARITGSYLLRDRQHCDTRLVVDHAVPSCTSREIFKCVVDGQARGVFQGKVIVRRDAQKTIGKQSSHGLLLSPTAEFDAKPELEIFADDVVCGHGATAGELDETMLFYLRSRGIPVPQAKALLVAAFAAEALDDVAHDRVRERLADVVAEWVREAETR